MTSKMANGTKLKLEDKVTKQMQVITWVSHFGFWFDENVVPIGQDVANETKVEAGDDAAGKIKTKKRGRSQDLVMSFYEIFEAYKSAYSDDTTVIEKINGYCMTFPTSKNFD